MKYKVEDKVRIKSIDWYNDNKASDDEIRCYPCWFGKEQSKWCGKVMTISDVRADHYTMIEDLVGYWTDEMIEGLVEEETKNNNDMEEKETLLGWVKESDSLRLVPHKDYEIKHDGDNFYLVKKKKEYPKTYVECCKVLNIVVRDLDILDNMLDTTDIIYTKNLDRLLNSFRRLLICRDAYWKLYGEEMGLGKPWEPDWKNHNIKYVLFNQEGEIDSMNTSGPRNYILAFPTAEMRDAFKENFDPDIEICKELI